VAAFQENSGVAEGLSLLSTLEETRALNKYLGNLSITRVFHEKWCTKTVWLKQKSEFLVKKLCILPLVSLLLPKICRLAST